MSKWQRSAAFKPASSGEENAGHRNRKQVGIARLLVLDFLADSAVLPKLVIEPLDIHGMKLVQLDIPQLGADVSVDEHFVVHGGAFPDSGSCPECS